MVHRILKNRLAQSQPPEPVNEMPLKEIAQKSSTSERRAMEAERDIVKLKKCQFMMDKVGENFSGMVTSVHAFGFFVELHELFVEGLVHVSSLDDDFYQYEEERHRLIGMNRRREFSIGSPIEVRVQKINLDRREIDFRLVEEERPVRGVRHEERGKPKQRLRRTRRKSR
jgi:ribonuclease R